MNKLTWLFSLPLLISNRDRAPTELLNNLCLILHQHMILEPNTWLSAGQARQTHQEPWRTASNRLGADNWYLINVSWDTIISRRHWAHDTDHTAAPRCIKPSCYDSGRGRWHWSCPQWWDVSRLSIDDRLILQLDGGVDLMANVNWKLFNNDSWVNNNCPSWFFALLLLTTDDYPVVVTSDYDWRGVCLHIHSRYINGKWCHYRVSIP